MIRNMTDKEMLLFAYGALKASSFTNQAPVIKTIEDHLYPPPGPEDSKVLINTGASVVKPYLETDKHIPSRGKKCEIPF